MWTFTQGALGHRYRRTAAAAILVATVGALLDLSGRSERLDTNVGLHILYKLRGARPPPPDIVIISMNKRSIDRLGLPSDIGSWPRALHANLITRLTEQGAAVIVFDVLFKEKRRPDTDTQLGEAIRRSGRTVLLQFLGRDTISRPQATQNSHVVSEVMISPVAEISYGAAGLGPFPLPRVPAKVDQFWAFKGGVSDVATMPLVALQVWALQMPEFAQSYTSYAGPAAGAAIAEYLNSPRRHGDLSGLMRQLRRITPENTDLRAVGDALSDGLVGGLAAAYRGADSYFLNFYGPAGTITTLPYDKYLTASEPETHHDVRGKAIFIGVSELTTADRKEGFYTVFSRDDGIDLSGVEIAATALANLLHGDMIRPVHGLTRTAIVFGFGAFVVALTTLISGFRGIIAGVAFGAICFAGAHYAFATHNLWLPVTVPLLVQLPLAILLGLLVHYGFAKRLSENFAHGVRYYVPESIARHLALGKAPAVSTEIVDGVCMVTDLAAYTPLSESLSPDALTRLTTEYYRLVGGPTEAHGGEVLRYTGDGMICAWTRAAFSSEQEMHRHACLAALEISEAIDRYSEENTRRPLSIRIGLHAGQFALGTVGGGHHFEQSVLGDVINTASRIESLNKKFRTRILASGPIAGDLTSVLRRRLGLFQLVGKSEVIPIFEIVGRAERATSEQVELCRRFAALLQAFEAENWRETARKLDRILLAYPHDGPAKYYKALCDRYREAPPQRGAGAVIVMEHK